MRFLFCDDNHSELNIIQKYIEQFEAEHDVCFSAQYFSSSDSLCQFYSPGCCDAVFLDILMPLQDGMDAAKKIRAMDKNVKIIFLTSSPEYALSSYDVKAYDYILKTQMPDRLYSVCRQLIEEKSKHPDSIFIKTHTGAVRIAFDKLCYVEVQQKKLYFHLDDGSIRDIYAPLREYEDKLLRQFGFIKVHRSYVVNMEHAVELTGKDLIMARGDKIPVSRLLHNEVRQAYTDFLFQSMGVN